MEETKSIMVEGKIMAQEKISKMETKVNSMRSTSMEVMTVSPLAIIVKRKVVLKTIVGVKNKILIFFVA